MSQSSPESDYQLEHDANVSGGTYFDAWGGDANEIAKRNSAFTYDDMVLRQGSMAIHHAVVEPHDGSNPKHGSLAGSVAAQLSPSKVRELRNAYEANKG